MARSSVIYSPIENRNISVSYEITCFKKNVSDSTFQQTGFFI